MTTKTTVHLKLPSPRAWYDLSTPVCAALMIFLILLVGLVIGRLRSVHAVDTAQPVAYVFIATPIPTVPTLAPLQVAAAAPAAAHYVVGFDSPNGRALGAIPEPVLSAITGRYGDDWLSTTHDGAPIWVRAGDLGARLANVAPAPAPAVIYIASQEAPQQPVATEPAAADDFYTTPPHVDPAFQRGLIGSDPNALACGGSVFCGGLTNAQAQAALDAPAPAEQPLQQLVILDRQAWAIQAQAARDAAARQQLVQQHYANDRARP